MVFLNMLKQATIMIILQKDQIDRTEKEYDRVIALLKSIEFFQKNKQLSYSDYRELAQRITYVEFEKDKSIYKFGDIAEVMVMKDPTTRRSR